jgi:hypothetical protein
LLNTEWIHDQLSKPEDCDFNFQVSYLSLMITKARNGQISWNSKESSDNSMNNLSGSSFQRVEQKSWSENGWFLQKKQSIFEKESKQMEK